jgi:hypothetical protein
MKSVFLQEAMQRLADDAMIFNKPSVVPCQTQEPSQLLDCFLLWPCLHIFDFGRVCSYSSTADNVAQVLHL